MARKPKTVKQTAADFETMLDSEGGPGPPPLPRAALVPPQPALPGPLAGMPPGPMPPMAAGAPGGLLPPSAGPPGINQQALEWLRQLFAQQAQGGQ